jgi:hypothetical protein
MDLQTRKLVFIQEFLKVQSQDVISQLEKILMSKTGESHENDLKPMTLDEFNARIDQSMDDSKNGRLIESNELKTKVDQWT